MNQWQKAQEALKLKTLSSAELGRLGVSRTSLQRWVADGRLVRLSRGLYGLQELPITENYSLLSANLQIPSGVICLISALMYHGVTTQLSGDVWIALQGRSHCPRFDYPKIRVHRFTGPAFLEGIEEHRIEGGVLRVYSIEKTIVDLFRLRNKVGLDVALEALKDGLRTKKAKLGRIHELAKKLRIYTVMRPYIEAEVSG